MTKRRMLVWETLSTVSGGQKMTLTVLDALAAEYDFCCLIPGEGMLATELEKRGIPYVRMGDQTLPTGVKGKSVIFRYGWMSLKNICRSLGAIWRFRPDVLYCPGPAALPWSAVCGLVTGKPVVWHLHHIFLDGATRRLLDCCGRWRCVKKILAVSGCVGDQLTDAAARGKVAVLYNPVDAERYAAGNADAVRAEVERTLGRTITPETVVLGQVALIQGSKKQAFTLDVLRALRASGKDAVGVFAGECREHAYFDALRQNVRENGLEQAAVFLGRRGDIPDLLRLIDVIMIPSFEGFPLAGLEAAAAGVPVAACDVAGAEEFARVSGAGLCFREDDAADAADAVGRLLEQKDRYAERGRAFAVRMTEAAYAAEIRAVFSHISEQNGATQS